MSIELVTFRILVKADDVLEDTKKYKSNIPGFVIAGDDQKREQQAVVRGRVRQVGPVAFHAYDTPNALQEGDWVYYAKFAGMAVVDPETDEELLVLNDEDIVCKIKG